MKINAELRKKQPEIHADECSVADIIFLSEGEYVDLYYDLLTERQYLADRRDLDREHDGIRSCFLVLCKGKDDGILINAQGEDFAYCSAFIPNARHIAVGHIQMLADYAISEGTSNTEDGRWEISYEELYQHFDAILTAENGNCQMLVETLRVRKEVEDLTVTEDGIDITYKPEYCPYMQVKEPPRKLYAAYATDLNIQLMKRKCPTAELVGTGEIHGQQLSFHGAHPRSWLTINPQEDASVPVAVWKLHESDEKKLGGCKKRKQVAVELDNGYTINASTFVDTEPYYFGLPAKQYYGEVYQGYVDHGFDVEILNDALKRSTLEFYSTMRNGRLEHSTPYREIEEKEIIEDACDETQLDFKQTMA